MEEKKRRNKCVSDESNQDDNQSGNNQFACFSGSYCWRLTKLRRNFLEQLALEAFVCCSQDRKKYLSYHRLSHVV
ncbi:hypothetical protein RYX36_018380, partial [Vicia faba]